MERDRKAVMEKMADGNRNRFQDVKHMSVEEAMRRRERLIFVDTRTQAERDVSMIEGAIDTKDFEGKADTLKDRDIVCYCTIGYRSSMYVRERNGIDSKNRYYNLHGSILAWTHAGGNVVDPHSGKVTKRVHTFGPKWACAEKSYEQIQFDQPALAGVSWYVQNLYRRASTIFSSS